jgi:hypothetical protein
LNADQEQRERIQEFDLDQWIQIIILRATTFAGDNFNWMKENNSF